MTSRSKPSTMDRSIVEDVRREFGRRFAADRMHERMADPGALPELLEPEERRLRATEAPQEGTPDGILWRRRAGERRGEIKCATRHLLHIPTEAGILRAATNVHESRLTEGLS